MQKIQATALTQHSSSSGGTIRPYMPRTLLRIIPAPPSLSHIGNVTEATATATATAATEHTLKSSGSGYEDGNPLLRLIHWVTGPIMVSLQELVQDDNGEVSTLKVTILAVASAHVLALVRLA